MPRQRKKPPMDQLEIFLITETTKLIGLYDNIKTSDPRSEKAITGDEITIEEEIHIVKNSWAVLISYAKIYGYKKFDNVDPDIEKFYLEKLNVQH